MAGRPRSQHNLRYSQTTSGGLSATFLLCRQPVRCGDDCRCGRNDRRLASHPWCTEAQRAHQSSSRKCYPRSFRLASRRNRSPGLRLVQFSTFFFKCPNHSGFVSLLPRMRRRSPGIARACSRTWVKYPQTYLKHFALNHEIAFMMRSRVVNMWAGWLASRMIQILLSAAPVFICTELCHILSVGPLSPRVATVSSLMYLPNRNGADKAWPRCCSDKSSNGREQNAWIVLSFTLRKKAERSTNDSDSSQAMRCDGRAISFKFFIASACGRSQ